MHSVCYFAHMMKLDRTLSKIYSVKVQYSSPAHGKIVKVIKVCAESPAHAKIEAHKAIVKGRKPCNITVEIVEKQRDEQAVTL